MDTSTRSRNWCFTLNNYTEEEEHIVFEMAFTSKYIVCGKERGASGTPHLQGYVAYENKKSFRQMQDVLERAHWESMKGTSEQASIYCKKEGDFFEYGDIPLSQQSKGDKEKERWDLALSAFRQGQFDQVPTDILVRYGKGLEYASQKLNTMIPLIDTQERMQWYYGGTGTGKSKKAREDNPMAYLKPCNKWWDNYQGQETVIIEDFDKNHNILVHHLKIWADRYPFPAEYKGGSTAIRPKKIIVTSNYHPNEIWTEASDLEPILRRFHITIFHKPL